MHWRIKHYQTFYKKPSVRIWQHVNIMWPHQRFKFFKNMSDLFWGVNACSWGLLFYFQYYACGLLIIPFQLVWLYVEKNICVTISVWIFLYSSYKCLNWQLLCLFLSSEMIWQNSSPPCGSDSPLDSLTNDRWDFQNKTQITDLMNNTGLFGENQNN